MLLGQVVEPYLSPFKKALAPHIEPEPTAIMDCINW